MALLLFNVQPRVTPVGDWFAWSLPTSRVSIVGGKSTRSAGLKAAIEATLQIIADTDSARD
jgi:hypothetical protein